MIFSTVEVKLPSLLFANPVFHVKPKPKEMVDPEESIKKCTLREDTLNTIVTDEDIDFGGEIELAILDSFFRFGIIEIGYSANWIDNPNADKPILRSDSKQPYYDKDNNVIKEPKKLPVDERIYAKRIPAANFRVGGIDGSRLKRCNWCGYWEYVRVEDLIANKGLDSQAVDRLNWSGARSADFVPDDYGREIEALTSSGDLIKIWHIWDIRSKKRLLIADTQQTTLYDKKFDRLPLFDLRFHRLVNGWYPLPPVTNWKPMQDELNEAREQARNHRKRFTRKFLYIADKLATEEETAKLLNGGDGTFVAVTGTQDIRTVVAPVENASLGPEGVQSLQISRDDFNIVSGASAETMNQAVDRQTATQSNIVNQRSQIRESKATTQVANWLREIGKEILLLAEEKFTQPFMVKIPMEPGQTGAMLPDQDHLWHQITTDDFKINGEQNIDFSVDISVESLSPVENENALNQYLKFLSILNQFPQISIDPLLVRQTAYLCGFRNEKVIQKMQYVAQLMYTEKLAQLTGGAAGGAGAPVNPTGANPLAQATVAQQTPPNLDQIKNQLMQQIGGGPVQ